jgi:serine/threonine-protein kinase SRPK3
MRSEYTPILVGATRLVAAAILTSTLICRTEDLWVLKNCIKYSSGDAREQRAFELIGGRATTTTHPGLGCLQRPSRQFTIESPRSGRHQCFLLAPSACHVEEAWCVLGDLPLPLVKEILGNTLKALDFLHVECKLIHTDLKLDNILFGFADDNVLAGYVEELAQHPERCKVHRGPDGDEYPVTKAKPFVLTKDSFAFPQLNDLGESVELPVANMGFPGPRVCSPKAFRTPETILGRPFNEKIDVWMVGCLTLQMLTGRIPIMPHGPNQPWTDAFTLAQHHALLGPPPPAFLAQSVNVRDYWAEDGTWTHPEHDVPKIDLEDMLEVVEDEKTRKDALEFVRSCLQWLPKDRLSAADLLKHRFLAGEPKAVLWKRLEEWEKKPEAQTPSAPMFTTFELPQEDEPPQEHELPQED